MNNETVLQNGSFMVSMGSWINGIADPQNWSVAAYRILSSSWKPSNRRSSLSYSSFVSFSEKEFSLRETN